MTNPRLASCGPLNPERRDCLDGGEVVVLSIVGNGCGGGLGGAGAGNIWGRSI
jgi:hypothetical protein